MSLLPGTPSVREVVIEALVERLKAIKPPNYTFDIKGRVYDLDEPPQQLTRPAVFIGQGQERVVPENSSTGTFRRRLPIIVTFEDKYQDQPTTAPSMRQAKTLRFLAEVQRAVGIAFFAGSNQVVITETNNGTTLTGATDLIEGFVEFELEYDTNMEDPRAA